MTERWLVNLESIEVLAIPRSLHELCMHYGISNLVVEINCLTIVESISSTDLPNSELGNIILDIRVLMSHFLTSTIQHGNRNRNYAAHKLA